jgi:hypothetical protein
MSPTIVDGSSGTAVDAGSVMRRNSKCPAELVPDSVTMNPQGLSAVRESARVPRGRLSGQVQKARSAWQPGAVDDGRNRVIADRSLDGKRGSAALTELNPAVVDEWCPRLSGRGDSRPGGLRGLTWWPVSRGAGRLTGGMATRTGQMSRAARDKCPVRGGQPDQQCGRPVPKLAQKRRIRNVSTDSPWIPRGHQVADRGDNSVANSN